MREQAVIGAVSLLVLLGAMGVAVATIASGAVEMQGLDAIFVVLVCLLAAAAFSLVALPAIRSGALREVLKRKPRQAPAPEQASAATAAPEKPAEGS